MTTNAARVSPCHTCDMMGREGIYPNCADECADINNYLVQIGDKPHTKSEKDLYLIFPPATKLQSTDFCSREEYSDLRKVLRQYKENSGLSSKQIAAEIGCMSYLINSMLLDNQKSMTKKKYQLFLKWLDKKDGLTIFQSEIQ